MQSSRVYFTGFIGFFCCLTTTADLSCPTNYTGDSSGDFCYKHVGVLNMRAASAACLADGATLPLFRSAAEVAEARALTKVTSHFWIGADDSEVERMWRLHGEGFISACGLSNANPAGYAKYALKWTNWGNGQPDNYQNNQDCAIVHAQNWWDDIGCTGTVDAICQYRKCYQVKKNPILPTGEIVLVSKPKQSCTETCKNNENRRCNFTNLRSSSDLDVLKHLVQAADMGGHKFALPTVNLAVDIQKDPVAPLINLGSTPPVIEKWRNGAVESDCEGIPQTSNHSRFCVCTEPIPETTKALPSTLASTTLNDENSDQNSDETKEKGCKSPYVKGFKCWHVAAVVALALGVGALLIGGQALCCWIMIREKKRRSGQN